MNKTSATTRMLASRWRTKTRPSRDQRLAVFSGDPLDSGVGALERTVSAMRLLLHLFFLFSKRVSAIHLSRAISSHELIVLLGETIAFLPAETPGVSYWTSFSWLLLPSKRVWVFRYFPTLSFVTKSRPVSVFEGCMRPPDSL